MKNNIFKALVSFLTPSNQLIKNSLNAHTWLGLTVGALMYLICLSGAVVVFFEEFERWEQPLIEEYTDYTVPQIQNAISNYLGKVEEAPKSLYVVLPTEAVPRIHIAGDDKEWFVNQDGSLSEPPVEGWTHMLKSLHVNLHLPQVIGIIIVGAFGAMLCGLIISGLLAHPRIFKDAFKLRLGGSKRMEQVDLHNRLSVWGTPFYFMIGLTGAFIGLVGVLIALIAPIDYAGDREAVVDEVYGGDPVINNSAKEINFQSAFDNLYKQDAQAKAIYLVIQNINTEKQFLEIAATLPNRLIYSEMYRFKSSGEFINYQGLSDGPVGRQAAYSVYRLHFGHFGSGWVKIVYGILGLALAVISVTGINIWLARRKRRSFINDLWCGFVWGTPLALSTSYFSGYLGVSMVVGFWGSLILAMAFCVIFRQEKLAKNYLIGISSLVLGAILAHYFFSYQSFNHNSAALKINLMLGGVMIAYFAYWGKSFRRSQSAAVTRDGQSIRTDHLA